VFGPLIEDALATHGPEVLPVSACKPKTEPSGKPLLLLFPDRILSAPAPRRCAIFGGSATEREFPSAPPVVRLDIEICPATAVAARTLNRSPEGREDTSGAAVGGFF
jgi:hypothetical protein